jgi:AcrR family transcriptional regulator
VLDAACAVFAQHGYHGATIEAVARLAGTPRPTVYELFGSKDELYGAVIDVAADRVVTRLSEAFTESQDFPLEAFVRHNFAAVFDLFENDPESVTVLLNAERGGLEPPMRAVADTRRRVLAGIADRTRDRWEQLGIDIGAAAEMLSLIYFGMAEAVAVRQARGGGWDREALIDLLTEFTLGGLYRLGREPEIIHAAGRRSPPHGEL